MPTGGFNMNLGASIPNVNTSGVEDIIARIGSGPRQAASQPQEQGFDWSGFIQKLGLAMRNVSASIRGESVLPSDRERAFQAAQDEKRRRGDLEQSREERMARQYKATMLTNMLPYIAKQTNPTVKEALLGVANKMAGGLGLSLEDEQGLMQLQDIAQGSETSAIQNYKFGQSLEDPAERERFEAFAGKGRGGGSSEFERLEAIPPEERSPEQQARLKRMTAESKGQTIEINTGDLTTPEGFTKTQLGALRDGVKSGMAAIEDGRRVLGRLQEAGKAGAGFLGAAIEPLGGVLKQIPLVGGSLEKLLPGDRDKIIRFRTDARLLVARSLETVTGEPSRYTEQDVKRANEALKTLTVDADEEDIRVALETFLEIENRGMRQRVPEIANSIGADLTQREDQLRVVREMVKLGVPKERAIDFVLDHLKFIGGK